MRMKGRWVQVPTLDVNGAKLVVKGKWIRTATVRSEDMREQELDRPEQYIKGLRQNKNRALKADIFSFTQKVPNTQPKYSYPFAMESIAVIRMTSFRGWWEGLPQETRKNVRRAQKRGVQVEVREFDDDLIQGIRGVNDDTPMRQGMANAYYHNTFEETKERYGEFLGRCDFICAYFGAELIGFLHLVYRREVASILNLTTKPSHFDKRPANALMAKAVEICEAKGIAHITYGRYNYGKKQDNPLREFKIRNGFGELLVPRFFAPLTAWGNLCMKANLHRSLIDLLPHSVITVGVRVRSALYSLRAPISRCSSTTERPNRTRQMERSIPPAGSNSNPPIAEN
jgi:hypothetical protein